MYVGNVHADRAEPSGTLGSVSGSTNVRKWCQRINIRRQPPLLLALVGWLI